MAIELPDARELSDEALQVLRLRHLRGLELGYTQVELAELLGVCNETISRWWTAYCARRHGLRLPGDDRRPQGIGRLLSDPQADRIKGLIDDNSPEKLGLNTPVDPPRRPRSDPQEEFHIDLAERTVGQYLRPLGLHVQKPVRHARKQDPDETSGCTRSTRPSAGNTGGCGDSVDRRGRRGGGPPARSWVRREGSVQPWKCRGRTFRVNQISAISNEGTLRLHDVQGFAQRGGVPAVFAGLILGASRKILLIADRLQAQDAGGGGLVGGEQGEDRGVLPAPVCAGAEPGGIFAQRHEGAGEQGRPAKRGGGPCATGWWRWPWITCRASRNMSSVISCTSCVQYAAPIEI